MILFARLALVAVGLFISRICLAQTAVVIVVPQPSTPEYHAFEHRLRSELVAEGFQPVSVEVPTDPNRQGLQDSARRLMSHAAISISIHDGMVSGSVWIQGRASYGDAWRTVPDYPVNEQAPAVFAVKATDVLHGGLLELGYLGALTESSRKAPADAPNPATNDALGPPARSDNAPRPAPPVTKPKAPPMVDNAVPRPTRSKSEKTPRFWHLATGGRAALNVADYPVGVGFTLAVARRVHAAWAVGVAATYLSPSRFNGRPGEGEAMVSQGLVGARIEYIQALSKKLSVFEQFESGLHTTFVSSNASTPYVAYSSRATTGYSQLGCGSIWSLSGSVAVLGSVNLLVPWRRTDIVIVDRVVAVAASPAITLDAGAQVSF